MNDTLNTDAFSQNTINHVPVRSFDQLNDAQKTIVLTGNNARSKKEKDSGFMGKFLGANPKNASIHIALIICVILLVFCLVDLLQSYRPQSAISSQVWDYVFPVITLSLGYIFGKSEIK